MNLDQEGLMSALHELAANSARFFGIECRFECPSAVLVEDNAAGTHLFRIAQEALSNAIRHGHAMAVVITLASEMTLTIRDNGTVFAEVPGESTGMGLHIMNYRARMIGGGLSVARHRDGGTTVRCDPRSTRAPLPQGGGKLRELFFKGCEVKLSLAPGTRRAICQALERVVDKAVPSRCSTLTSCQLDARMIRRLLMALTANRI